MKDSRKLMIVGAALWLTATIFLLTAELVRRLIVDIYQHNSKPKIQLVEPKR